MAAEILLVEDRESLRSMLAETLAREGYGVEAVATGDEAVRRLAEGRRYALVLTDLKLPGADGLAVLDAALASDASLPVILLTGFGTVETAVVAMKRGAADFLGKPVDVDLLLLLVRRHVDARRSAVARTLLAQEAGLAENEVAGFGDAPTREAEGAGEVLLGRAEGDVGGGASEGKHAELPGLPAGDQVEQVGGGVVETGVDVPGEQRVLAGPRLFDGAWGDAEEAFGEGPEGPAA